MVASGFWKCSTTEVSGWSFLTNHARTLVYIAQHADARLRDIGDALGVTERTAFAIVADLTEAGYVVKERDGRRNRYAVQAHLPLPDPVAQERTVGEVLELLAEVRRPGPPARGSGRRAP
jgi:DNA-binding IclR family transcriptional regulator